MQLQPALKPGDFTNDPSQEEDFHTKWLRAPFGLANLWNVVQNPETSNKLQDFPLFIRHN